MRLLVIDIGGTNFRIGVFGEDRAVTDVHRFKTPNFINNPTRTIEELQALLIETLIDKIKEYRNKYPDITIVGLSFPAAITRDGVTHKVPTIWGEKGAHFPLRERLQLQLPDVRWVIANDITAAAERYGQMEKYKDVDYLGVITVSSGNGNKIYDVKNKKVILDSMSIGGEVGHVQYSLDPDAPVCDCGGRGHLAGFASGRAIERIVQNAAKEQPEEFSKSYLHELSKKPDAITNTDIVKAAKEHDAFVLTMLDKATLPIAYIMGMLSGTIGVGKFVIIGGFALNLGDLYLESLRKNVQRIDFFSRTPEEIRNLAELGINDDNDCLLGIGLLALNEV